MFQRLPISRPKWSIAHFVMPPPALGTLYRSYSQRNCSIASCPSLIIVSKDEMHLFVHERTREPRKTTWLVYNGVVCKYAKSIPADLFVDSIGCKHARFGKVWAEQRCRTYPHVSMSRCAKARTSVFFISSRGSWPETDSILTTPWAFRSIDIGKRLFLFKIPCRKFEESRRSNHARTCI